MQAYLKKMPEGSTLIAERTNAKTGKVVKCLVEAAPTKYLESVLTPHGAQMSCVWLYSVFLRAVCFALD